MTTKTRYLPGLSHDDSTVESAQGVRFDKRRSYLITSAILADIEAANLTGHTPTIVSVGLDAFCCSTSRLASWLVANPNLALNLVLRLKSLDYGMSDKYVTETADAWWTKFTHTELRDARAGQQDARTEELFAAWDDLQGRKDSRVGENALKNGRNSTIYGGIRGADQSMFR